MAPKGSARKNQQRRRVCDATSAALSSFFGLLFPPLGLGLGLGLWVNSNRVSLYVCKFVSCKSVVCNRKLSNLCVRELMVKALRGCHTRWRNH